MNIRLALQAGKGRKLCSLATALAFFYLLERIWTDVRALNHNPLDALQKIAFVAAAFSVTAYNLRTRVVDLVLKVEGAPAQTFHTTRVARDCGRRLTNLVILFTSTASLMGAAGFFPINQPISKWYACIVFGLFGSAIVNFIYVLFAFERLERFTLDEAEDRSRQRDAKRLVDGK